MELAIIKNKPDFVDLLIENKIDLTGFLTEKRLLFLFFLQKQANDLGEINILEANSECK